MALIVEISVVVITYLELMSQTAFMLLTFSNLMVIIVALYNKRQFKRNDPGA